MLTPPRDLNRLLAMLSERFEILLNLLLKRYVRYDEARKDPSDVIELARARMELDDIRKTIAREREEVMGLGDERALAEWYAFQDMLARNDLFSLGRSSGT